MAQIAKIAIENAVYAIDKPYDYLVPEDMTVCAGMRVTVPFGRGNRRSEGMVLSVQEGTMDRPLKAVETVLDREPQLSAEQIRLALWMCQRYFCTFYDALHAILPIGLWYQHKELWHLKREPEGELPEKEQVLVYLLREKDRELSQLLEAQPKAKAMLQKLEQQGYEIKRGKHTSVKGARQKRFIRFRTLGAGYSEDEIKAVLEGKAKHQPYQKQPPKEQPFQLLVDIQGKMAEGKSVGYKKWATKFNLKEMSKTLLFLQEQKIGSAEELRERAAAATERYHELGNSIKAAEARLTQIAVLKTHIINYAKTRPAYDSYRKSGYSKKFLEAHREEITLHKAAKAAFDEAGMKKLPKVKELDAEYAELLIKKKAAYPDYRKARDEMQQLMKAQKNVELFFAEDKSNLRPQHTR